MLPFRMHEGVEAVRVPGRNVDEKERRRFVRQRRQELPAQIALDSDHGDQKGEAQAERYDDAGRDRARPVDVGDRQGDDRRARAREAARDQHDERGEQAQQHEHAGGHGDEDGRRAPIVGQHDHQRGERAAQDDSRRDVGRARPAPLARDLVAE